MSDKIHDSNEDEVNFFKIFDILWDKKIVIILLSIVPVIITIVYINLKSNRYQGNIKINLQTNEYISRFFSVNVMDKEVYLYIKSELIDNDFGPTKKDTSIMKISAKSLEKDFISTFRNYNNLYKLIKKLNIDLKIIRGTIAEKDKIYKSIAQSLNIKEFKVRIDNKIESRYEMEFTHTSTEEGKKLISEIFKFFNMKIRHENVQKLNNIKQVLINQYNYNLSIKQKEIYTNIAKYKNELKNISTFLNEQLLIAKSLNIKNSDFSKNQLTIYNGNKQNFLNKSDYYKRGYKVIEKELEIIALRKKGDEYKYIDNYPILKSEIENIKNNNIILKFENAIKLTPLLEDNFKAVIYNSDKIKFKNLFKWKLLIIGSTLFGFLFSIFIVLIFNSYRNYKFKSL